MNHLVFGTSIILFLLVSNIICHAQVQGYWGIEVGGFVGYNNSPTFDEYSEYYNKELSSQLKTPLKNFDFISGLGVNAHSELKSRKLSTKFGFKYGRGWSQTQAVFNTDNIRRFSYSQDSFWALMGIGKSSDRVSLFLNLHLMYTSNKIFADYYYSPNYQGPPINTSIVDGTYTGGQFAGGAGLQFVFRPISILGIYIDAYWIGNVFPRRVDRTEMFDSSFYDDVGFYDLNYYYLHYTNQNTQEEENVRADFRSFRVEFGVQFRIRFK